MQIFFDIDGVLIKGWHANPELRIPWNIDLEQDLGIAREDFRQALFVAPADGDETAMSRCSLGKDDLKSVLAAVLPTLGFTGAPQDVMDYWFRKDSRVSAELLGQVRQLKKLASCAVHIATQQEHHRAKYLWQQLDFQADFQSMQYSAEIGFAKTDPQFYAAVNRRLELPADPAPLFFDDSPEVVEVACAAGWDAVIYETPSDVAEHPRIRALLEHG